MLMSVIVCVRVLCVSKRFSQYLYTKKGLKKLETRAGLLSFESKNEIAVYFRSRSMQESNQYIGRNIEIVVEGNMGRNWKYSRYVCTYLVYV